MWTDQTAKMQGENRTEQNWEGREGSLTMTGLKFISAFTDAGKTSMKRWTLKLPLKNYSSDVNIIIRGTPSCHVAQKPPDSRVHNLSMEEHMSNIPPY